MNIPFFPPDMFEADKQFIFDLVYQAGTTNSFILKHNVHELEMRFRQKTGAAHAVACHSGTGAVALALRSIGIRPGDEVIVQGFCCQPVASEVIHLGARPVFVDVDPRTMVMDPTTIEERITARTRAILPAHLFSCMVDMHAVREVARRYDLKVIEDACVQLGARQKDFPAGRWGDAGTYSFFQMKVMGGCGEGGMIVTDDERLASACRMLRNHGQDGKTRFLHHRIGVNSRMDEIMAGFLLRRLDQLDEILDRRAQIAEYYQRRFAVIADQIVLPPPDSNGRCYYMYTIQTRERDGLKAFLRERGIGSHIYYPRLLTDQRAFNAYVDPLDCLGNARRAARENLALPIYPHLSDSQAKVVADAVIEFFDDKRMDQIIEPGRFH